MSNTVRGLLDGGDTTAVGEQLKNWSTKSADEIIADLRAMLDEANRDPAAFFRSPDEREFRALLPWPWMRSRRQQIRRAARACKQRRGW